MALTDTAIKNAKPKEKPYKLSDKDGMYLLVHPNGGKYFRLDYRFAGKRKTLALGTYPNIPLKEAREKAYTVKKGMADGIDAGLKRKIEKQGSIENTLSAIAKEYIEANRHRWSPSHLKHVEECFNRDVLPWLGDRQVKDLVAVEVLSTLKRIVNRGALETAHRTKQFLGQAIRYGIATGRAERDVTADLRGALPSPVKGHYPAITEPKTVRAIVKGY